jgi:hypothetical protein
MSIFKLDSECGIGKVLKNLALHFNDIFFRHLCCLVPAPPLQRTGNPAPLKFAFFSRLSY